MPAALPDLPPNIFTNIPRVKPVDSVTVLLFDSLNTPLADQSFVRDQMLKFLKTVQPGRRIAIFTLGTRLRFVEGFTDDPAVLAAALDNSQNGSSPRSVAAVVVEQRERCEPAERSECFTTTSRPILPAST